VPVNLAALVGRGDVASTTALRPGPVARASTATEPSGAREVLAHRRGGPREAWSDQAQVREGHVEAALARARPKLPSTSPRI
jgi:hypothetical protein